MTDSEVSANWIWRKAYWPSLMTLFLIVHLTTDKLRMLTVPPHSIDSLLLNMPVAKLLLFIPALALVTFPVAADLGRSVKANPGMKSLWWSLLFVVLLLCLVWQTGNASMGETYAGISLHPFAQPGSVYSRRLLMPAIAHILFIRGDLAYYLFSMSLTAAFIALLHNWCIKNTSLKNWQIFSLCTSSFVLFSFQFPGYPDVLFFILMILAMAKGLGQKSRLTLLILALLVHESSVFICPLLALRYLDRERMYHYVAAVSLYFMVFFAAHGFNVHAVFGMHAVQSKSGLDWVLGFPVYEMLGLAFAWKAFWLVAAVATFHALRGKNYRDGFFIPAAMFSGILVTFLAVDTSRLAGFAFPGMLVSLTVLSAPDCAATSRSMAYLYLLNIIIPSVYVGLNTGIIAREGIYGFIFQSLQWLG